jgi:hypothetical protein
VNPSAQPNTAPAVSRSLAPLGLSALVGGGLVVLGVLFGGADADAQRRPAPKKPAAAAKGPGLAPGALPGKTPGVGVLDTSSPFNHETHLSEERVGKALNCASCHEMVNADGSCPKQEVRYPKHEACAGCHTANFYTPPLTICTNCHVNASFSANNPLKELGRQVTPRKSEFSHASHSSSSCTECHRFLKGGDQVAHPSHPNCCQCHTDAAMQPTMNNCQGCHSASRNAGRAPSKIHSFTHKAHNTDPRNGKSTECSQCHLNVNASRTLRTIPTPPMASCVGCHDGTDPGQPHPSIPDATGSGAFHFSSCLKCHLAGSISGVALPAGHPTDAAPPGAIQ